MIHYNPLAAHNNLQNVTSRLSATGLPVDPDKHYAAPGLLLQHVEAQAMVDAANGLLKALEQLRFDAALALAATYRP